MLCFNFNGLRMTVTQVTRALNGSSYEVITAQQEKLG